MGKLFLAGYDHAEAIPGREELERSAQEIFAGLRLTGLTESDRISQMHTAMGDAEGLVMGRVVGLARSSLAPQCMSVSFNRATALKDKPTKVMDRLSQFVLYGRSGRLTDQAKRALDLSILPKAVNTNIVVVAPEVVVSAIGAHLRLDYPGIAKIASVASDPELMAGVSSVTAYDTQPPRVPLAVVVPMFPLSML